MIAKVLLYFFSTLLLIVGLSTLALAEFIFGILFLCFGLSLLPALTRQWQPGHKLSVPALVVGLLVLAFYSVRQDQAFITEPAFPEIENLSQHTVRMIEIDGFQQYYIESGEQYQETVILLHGFPDMANTWDETITSLSVDRHVIAPFLRGYYPTSMAADNDYSVKTIAHDIVSMAEGLGLEKYAVVGQDWGASIAYSMANLAPNKVSKIATLAIPHNAAIIPSPSLLYAGRHFFVFAFEKWAIRFSANNNFEYIDTLYQRWSPDFKNYSESSNAIKQTFLYQGRLAAALGYYRSFFDDQSNQEKLQFYSGLPTMPVLFLGGANDVVVTDELAQAMEQKMPTGSRVIIYKNAGHFLHREVFDQYITDLSTFINGD